MTTLTELECTACGRRYDPQEPRGVCECGGPLMARYDLERARQGWSREWIPNGPSSMWRYAPVLPVHKPPSVVSLGEGMTPLIHARRAGERFGARRLLIKDEGVNPAGSIQARGASCAVSMAVELGVGPVGIAAESAAGCAVAAYAAAAGIEARVALPAGAPASCTAQCRMYGVQEGGGGFDLGAFREPYRVEGLKTVGYEIAEQMNWRSPDAILCPIGTGASLVAIGKAFEELLALGWILERRPRLFGVSLAGAAAAAMGAPWFARAAQSDGGHTVDVSAAEAIQAGLDLASLEGVFAAPEGAACLAALEKLTAAGDLQPEDQVVMVNSRSGLSALETYARVLPGGPAPEADKLGGLITPR